MFCTRFVLAIVTALALTLTAAAHAEKPAIRQPADRVYKGSFKMGEATIEATIEEWEGDSPLKQRVIASKRYADGSGFMDISVGLDADGDGEWDTLTFSENHWLNGRLQMDKYSSWKRTDTSPRPLPWQFTPHQGTVLYALKETLATIRTDEYLVREPTSAPSTNPTTKPS